jgi:hypothetical protein
MSTTACTSYYTTVVTGYLPGTGLTSGNIVTYTTPKPVWSDNVSVVSETNNVSLQCNSVALGGFNGLNN